MTEINRLGAAPGTLVMAASGSSETSLAASTADGASMKQSLALAEYPLFTLEITREESRFDSVEAICGYFRNCIESHRAAEFIAEFDHYAHTQALAEGHIGEGILAAKNVIFCLGIALPNPYLLADRPRSIGIAETDRGFLITFLEAPMPVVNAAMEDWTFGLCKKPVIAD